MKTLRTFFLLPVDDLVTGLEDSLRPGPGHGAYLRLALVGLGLAVGWWLYVPLHELLHAAGCLVTGGKVDRLEVAALYGGDLLAQVFPFVVAGGDYAGRLAGFDTGGSDAVYLATVLAPYLLTLLPGVWALRRVRHILAWWGAFAWGALLSFALAPFLSIPGDGYEVGSIVVTWVPPFADLHAELRGDDVFKLAGELQKSDAGGLAWLGLGVATCLSILWAWATYGLASWIAHLLGQQRAIMAP
jgi:hypothetical protein